MIRKLLAIFAVATVGSLAAPQAEAGHSSLSITYRSGYSSCGCPIYTKRFVRGYDCYRRPIFGYTRLAFTHGSSCRHRAVHRPTYVRPATSYIRGHSRSRVHAPRVVIGSGHYSNRGRSYGRRNVGRHYGPSRCR